MFIELHNLHQKETNITNPSQNACVGHLYKSVYLKEKRFSGKIRISGNILHSLFLPPNSGLPETRICPEKLDFGDTEFGT